MKKYLLLAFALSMLLVLTTVAFGCNKKPEPATVIQVRLFDDDVQLNTFAVSDNDFSISYTPEKEGYSFVGWFLDAELTRPLSGLDIATYTHSQLPLYAKFDILPTARISVCFTDINETADYGKLDYDYNNFPVPTDPSKENCIFEGWFMDKLFTIPYGKDQLDSLPKGSSVKVYAHFVRGIKVTFTDVGETQIFATNFYLYSGTAPTTRPQKENHTFFGWYMDKAFTTAYSLSQLDKLPRESEVKIYAKLLRGILLTFTDFDQTQVFSEQYYLYYNAVTPEAPSLNGLAFRGWYMDKQFTVPYGKEQLDKLPQEGCANVFARFSPPITLNFANADLSETYGSETYNFQSLNTPDISREGYSFEGWFLDADLTQPLTVEFLSTKNGGEELQIYGAVYRQGTLFFYSQGEVISQSYYVDTIVFPEAPVRQGYIFKGWYADTDGLVEFTQAYMNRLGKYAGASIYALWLENKTLNISYVDKNGEVVGQGTLANRQLSAPELTLNEYRKPDGFFADSAFKVPLTAEVLLESNYENNSTVTAYVRIIEITLVYVDFYTDVQKQNLHASAQYTGEFTMPEAPVVQDYAFEGWFTDTQFTLEFKPEQLGEIASGTHVSVYAKLRSTLPTVISTATSEDGCISVDFYDDNTYLLTYTVDNRNYRIHETYTVSENVYTIRVFTDSANELTLVVNDGTFEYNSPIINTIRACFKLDELDEPTTPEIPELVRTLHTADSAVFIDLYNNGSLVFRLASGQKERTATGTYTSDNNDLYVIPGVEKTPFKLTPVGDVFVCSEQLYAAIESNIGATEVATFTAAATENGTPDCTITLNGKGGATLSGKYLGQAYSFDDCTENHSDTEINLSIKNFYSTYSVTLTTNKKRFEYTEQLENTIRVLIGYNENSPNPDAPYALNLPESFKYTAILTAQQGGEAQEMTITVNSGYGLCHITQQSGGENNEIYYDATHKYLLTEEQWTKSEYKRSLLFEVYEQYIYNVYTNLFVDFDDALTGEAVETDGRAATLFRYDGNEIYIDNLTHIVLRAVMVTDQQLTINMQASLTEAQQETLPQ